MLLDLGLGFLRAAVEMDVGVELLLEAAADYRLVDAALLEVALVVD